MLQINFLCLKFLAKNIIVQIKTIVFILSNKIHKITLFYFALKVIFVEIILNLFLKLTSFILRKRVKWQNIAEIFHRICLSIKLYATNLTTDNIIALWYSIIYCHEGNLFSYTLGYKNRSIRCIIHINWGIKGTHIDCKNLI